jgi:ABC-type sugar transport system substrate-binding protein
MRRTLQKHCSRSILFSLLAAALTAGLTSLPAAAQSTQAATNADTGTVWWNELISADPDRRRMDAQNRRGRGQHARAGPR